MARSLEASDVPQVETVWYHDWVKSNVSDLTGKVAVVTGANSGTGFWCAAALASKGAHVVLACRSEAKAAAAKQEIVQMHPTAQVSVIHLDNMDLDSVRQFVDGFNGRFSKLDLLVNNAGIMAQKDELSKDGHDVQFQTNHLAHFLLTTLLWPKIMAATQARIVHHSSGAHWMGSVMFSREEMSVPRASCSGCWFWNGLAPCMGLPREPWRRYCMSKLCNMLFGIELQRRIDDEGLAERVSSVMCHPGYASTQLQKYAGDAGSFKNWEDANTKNAQSAADGSLPLLMACISEEMEGGMYCGPSQSNEMKGPPRVCRPGGYAQDGTMAEELWDYSEECCKVRFEVNP